MDRLEIPASPRAYMLVLEGCISAGKTTLAHRIKALFPDTEVELHEEYRPEALLNLFYTHPERYALTLQLYMMNHRVACWRISTRFVQAGMIQPWLHLLDRSIFGDYVFAALNHSIGNISTVDFDLYDAMWREQLEPSSLWTGAQRETSRSESPEGARNISVAYLDAVPGVTAARIRERNHDSEQTIDEGYLVKLYLYYFNAVLCWIEMGMHVVIHDWNSFADAPDPIAVLRSCRAIESHGWSDGFAAPAIPRVRALLHIVRDPNDVPLEHVMFMQNGPDDPMLRYCAKSWEDAHCILTALSDGKVDVYVIPNPNARPWFGMNLDEYDAHPNSHPTQLLNRE